MISWCGIYHLLVWVVSFFGVDFIIFGVSCIVFRLGVVVPTRVARHASVLGHAVTALGAPHVRTHLRRWRCVCVCVCVCGVCVYVCYVCAVTVHVLCVCGDCAWYTTRAHTPEAMEVCVRACVVCVVCVCVCVCVCVYVFLGGEVGWMWGRG